MCTAGRAGGTLHYFVLKEMPPSSALASLNFTTTKFTPSGVFFFQQMKVVCAVVERGEPACERPEVLQSCPAPQDAQRDKSFIFTSSWAWVLVKKGPRGLEGQRPAQLRSGLHRNTQW